MRYASTKLDNWVAKTPEQQDVKGKAIDCIENGKNLIMLGNTGTGKTMLAHAMVNERKGEVVRVSKMLRCIMESVQGKSQYTCSDQMSYLAKIPLLVMDEFGVDELTPAQFRYINEIIDSRYMNELPTVFVSNMDFEQFKSMVGIRVMDRLKGANVVIFGWESER